MGCALHARRPTDSHARQASASARQPKTVPGAPHSARTPGARACAGRPRLRLGHADGQPGEAHARVQLDLLLGLRQVLHAAGLVRLLRDDLNLLLRTEKEIKKEMNLACR